MQIYKASFQEAMNPYMTEYLGPKRSALGKEIYFPTKQRRDREDLREGNENPKPSNQSDFVE